MLPRRGDAGPVHPEGSPAWEGSPSPRASRPRTSRSRLPPQLLEHHRVDRLDAVHPLLEILAAGPAEEGVLELAVEAEAPQTLAQLRAELLVDGEPLLPGGLAEDRLVQTVDPAQLFERPSVITPPQVDENVGEVRIAAVLLDDKERRRLLTPAVAAGGLRGIQALQQPLGERSADGPLEGLGERVHRVLRDQD